MAAPVSRQKINLASANFSSDERVGRRSKWRVDLMVGRIEQLLHLIQSAAANDADRWKFILHSRKLSGLNPKNRQLEKGYSVRGVSRLPMYYSVFPCRNSLLRPTVAR